MNKFFLASSFAVAGTASPLTYDAMFEEFVAQHRPTYASAEERAERLEVFRANMKFAEETNARQSAYTLGASPFADLTFEEFRSQYIGSIQMASTNTTKSEPAELTTEDSVDWVAKGAVTPVKNQGRCGSCWTFSTTGALEGAMKVAGREMVPLSEQDLVSCDTGFMAGNGCKGGNPGQAIGWVKSNGICSEEGDAYKCMDQASATCTGATCNNKECKKVLKGGIFSSDIHDFGQVSQLVGHLETFVAKGPVSVAIEADKPVFQLYKGGVLTDDACGQKIDHAVLAVGYGEDNGVKYWHVKNSWGAAWGEKGYLRIARDKDAVGTYGECGIRFMAFWVTVKSTDDVSSDNGIVV